MSAADPPDGALPRYDPGQVAYCPTSGKVRHPSRRVAVENLKRVRKGLDAARKDRRQCGALGVYRCRHCSGGWHIGNHSPDRAKPPRRGRKDCDQDEAA
ncbi:MAG: hypothetical protein K2V38_05465 [Gemmataceae bacterium]|nr:hypothetical protein [Gemmataceae bacterium]